VTSLARYPRSKVGDDVTDATLYHEEGTNFTLCRIHNYLPCLFSTGSYPFFVSREVSPVV